MKDSTIIDNLSRKINNLQSTVDSLNLNSSIRQLNYELQQKQDVITHVNNFYDSAWVKLLIVISIIGIIIPIIAQHFQRKSLKDLTEFIRNQMNDTLQLKIEELKSYSKQEIDNSINDLNSTIKQMENRNKLLLNEIDASTYYLQGRASVLSKDYSMAIISFLKSTYLYLEGERPERSKVQLANLKLCLRSISEISVLDKTSKLIKESSLGLNLEEALVQIKEHPSSNLYHNQLIEIEKEITRIKATA